MNSSKEKWFYTEEFDASNYDTNTNWPKISIVTPTFNYGHLIEETFLSVIKQNYPNIEFIVIDGLSKDNTIEVIKKYEDHIDYWCSEKDTGQPSAINKGLQKCTGNIFNWLNSDDYLEKGALYQIAKAFVDTNADIVAGVVRYFDDDGFEEYNSNTNQSSSGIMCWEKDVRFIQPGVWMKLENLKAINGVDEDPKMRFAFDWDMIIRYLYFYPKVTYIPQLLVHYRFHPISNTISDPDRYPREEAYIIEKLSKNADYSKLHPVCNYKIRRKNWYEFLLEVGNSDKKRHSKILQIVKNLHRQPWKKGVPRITGGVIRQILYFNKLKT